MLAKGKNKKKNQMITLEKNDSELTSTLSRHYIFTDKSTCGGSMVAKEIKLCAWKGLLKLKRTNAVNSYGAYV